MCRSFRLQKKKNFTAQFQKKFQNTVKSQYCELDVIKKTLKISKNSSSAFTCLCPGPHLHTRSELLSPVWYSHTEAYHWNTNLQ